MKQPIRYILFLPVFFSLILSMHASSFAEGTATQPAQQPENAAASPAGKSAAATSSAETTPLPGTLAVTGITFVETQKRAVVFIHIPGMIKPKRCCRTRTIRMAGTKWIVVTIRHAVSNILEPVKIDSDFVGKVIVEENTMKGGSVLVKIENPRSSRFKVQKGNRLIKVTIFH